MTDDPKTTKPRREPPNPKKWPPGVPLPGPQRQSRSMPLWVMLIIITFMAFLIFNSDRERVWTLTYTQFMRQVLTGGTSRRSRSRGVDTDGDGVADGVDQCSNTQPNVKVDSKGCPVDGDGDGVPDGIDQCANTPQGAQVDSRGCPIDSDADGIADGIDQCANTPAGVRVDASGCPIEVSEKETQFLDTGVLRLAGVRFETGKAALRPESYPALDEVGRILEQWPQLQIEIGGHTDSRGSNELNQRLSEQRAQSVLDYLKGKSASYLPRGWFLYFSDL